MAVAESLFSSSDSIFSPKPLVLDAAIDFVPWDLPTCIVALNSHLTNQVDILEVDLSSFKLKGKRKPKNQGPPKVGSKTKISSGPSSKLSAND